MLGRLRGAVGGALALPSWVVPGCGIRLVAQTYGVSGFAQRSAVGVILMGALLTGCSATSVGQGGSALPSQEPGREVTLEPAVDHVHAAIVHGDALLLGTHSGLVEVDLNSGQTKRRGGSQDDFMGLAVDQTVLVASGHPGAGSSLPDPLGLLRSADAGATWVPVSLTGQVDFHGLAIQGSRVAGIGTADGVLISSDSGVTWIAAGVADGRSLAWFGEELWIATDNGLRIWRAGILNEAPETDEPVIALAADATGSTLWAVSAEGSVWQTINGQTWAKHGSVTELQAFAATTDTAYVVTAQSVSVITSAK